MPQFAEGLLTSAPDPRRLRERARKAAIRRLGGGTAFLCILGIMAASTAMQRGPAASNAMAIPAGLVITPGETADEAQPYTRHGSAILSGSERPMGDLIGRDWTVRLLTVDGERRYDVLDRSGAAIAVGLSDFELRRLIPELDTETLWGEADTAAGSGITDSASHAPVGGPLMLVDH